MRQATRSAVLDGRPDQADIGTNLEALGWFAELRVPKVVDDRVQLLAEKNSEGAISDEERRELEFYVDAGDLLSIAKAKARNLLASTE